MTLDCMFSCRPPLCATRVSGSGGLETSVPVTPGLPANSHAGRVPLWPGSIGTRITADTREVQERGQPRSTGVNTLRRRRTGSVLLGMRGRYPALEPGREDDSRPGPGHPAGRVQVADRRLERGDIHHPHLHDERLLAGDEPTVLDVAERSE